MLTYAEIQDLNKEILTVQECNILHEQGNNIICEDGKVTEIMEDKKPRSEQLKEDLMSFMSLKTMSFDHRDMVVARYELEIYAAERTEAYE